MQCNKTYSLVFTRSQFIKSWCWERLFILLWYWVKYWLRNTKIFVKNTNQSVFDNVIYCDSIITRSYIKRTPLKRGQRVAPKYFPSIMCENFSRRMRYYTVQTVTYSNFCLSRECACTCNVPIEPNVHAFSSPKQTIKHRYRNEISTVNQL